MQSIEPTTRKPNRPLQVAIVLVILAAIGVGIWANWHRIAVAVAPAKKAAQSRSAAALAADRLFWQTFHGANYDAIEPALNALTAAYLATPNDAITAAHIAWLHTWRVAERARLGMPPATITDDIVVAHKYFREATRLDPSDARYLGFLATQLLAEGRVHQDERLTRAGYFLLLDSVKAWPEFNLFTAGYVMSDLPTDSPRFKEGLDDEWRNLDVCVSERVNRANPDYSKYMPLETQSGRKRVCWNSWIAPHNFEGFFLNMGDMLVKSGDWRTAQVIYRNATLSREYASWKFRDVLDERIKRAKELVSEFNRADGAANKVMLDSPFACMACHEQ